MVAPTPKTSRKRGRLGKSLLGLFLLIAIIVIVNRFVTSDEGSNPSRSPTISQAQVQPSRTPDGRDRIPTRLPSSQANSNEVPAGFAPASWTSTLPSGVASGTMMTIFDGDTYDISVDGQTRRYRLYRADTPETHDPLECGGNEATAFVRAALAQSDTPGKIWVEDVGQLDQYGRTLAYLWFTIDGQPFLLNHLLIESGWAENKSYGDSFDPYRSEIGAAATNAAASGLGVWGACGNFGIPAQAALAAPTTVSAFQSIQGESAKLGNNCHPSYIPCVPISSVDLDCKDVGFRVEVIGYDEYRLDNDDPDLIGCESWPPKS